jgi:undecaprenyl-diphosphatase
MTSSATGLLRALWARATKLVEGRGLIEIGALCAAAWLFLAVADEVTEGDTSSIDRRILLAFRSAGDPRDPIGPRWLEESMRDVTALGGFTFLTFASVLLIAALLFWRRRREALVFATVVLATLASSELLKLFFGRARPDLVPHGSIVYSASFPSGHSTLSAAVFLTAAVILASLVSEPRAKAFILAIGALVVVAVGISRVYLGVHWPTDVLGGWALGAGWALLARILLRPRREEVARARPGAEAARDAR